jgi:hypothetical protein
LGVGTLTSLISGLKPNTLYYVLGYALNAAGIGYIGNGNTITTLPSAVAVPTVIIGGLSNITATQGTCGATVTNDGGATVTERGFVYIIQVYPPVMPTMENRLGKIICGTGTGVFSGTLTGLNPDTCYAVRPYAINSAGTGFSAPYNAFNTLKQSTVSVSGVTNTYAYFDMVWRSNYGFITKTGIVINTHANPLSGEVGDKGFLLDYPVPNKMVITGSVSISSLSPNTTYFVRAVYQTASGIYYGEEVTFTTLT